MRRAITKSTSKSGENVFKGRVGASPYAMFLRKYAKHPTHVELLKSHGVRAGGKLLGKWFRTLPTAEMARFKREAKIFKIKPRVKKPRKVNPFNLFVRKMMRNRDVLKLRPTKRFAKIADLWKKQQHK